jgi:hypothetical protein
MFSNTIACSLDYVNYITYLVKLKLSYYLSHLQLSFLNPLEVLNVLKNQVSYETDNN